MQWSRRFSSRIAAGVVVVFLVLGVTAWLTGGPGQRTITAYFTSAAALYSGNPVEVLGVPVGSVASVTPEAGRVRVVLHVDRDVRLPADVHALQISPSLISGRSIALAPVYTDGPAITGDAVIPVERTEVPLDVNDLFRNADELSTALGPQGANKNGSLSRFLDVLAANLDGNGDRLARMIKDFGSATSTLAGSSTDLTGTVTGLQQFVSTLAAHDGEMQQLNTRLASVTGSLAQDRYELSGALQQLSGALGTVATFVQENRALLRTNVNKLTRVSRILVKERAILGQVVDEAPAGLGSLFNAYNATTGTLDVRMDVNELQNEPAALLCMLVERSTPGQLPASLSSACGKILDALGATGKLPDLAGLLSALQGDPASLLSGTQGGGR